MTTHYDDEAQAERLKQWWKDNWMALAGGLVIGLAAIFGWEGWQNHRSGQAAAASRMYEDLKLALDESRASDATAIGDALMEKHSASPYAAGAALYLAANAVGTGQLDVALEHLRWVRNNADDPAMRQIATLREARVLWQQDQADAALKLLDGEPGHFAAQYAELRGDIELSRGDRAGARVAYEKALQSLDAEDPAQRSGLQRKIDDLADVVQS